MKNNIVVNSLLLSSAVVAIGATNSYATQTGTVTASALNIRSGAGTNYSVITKVYKGESVNILDSSNGWNKVELSNGKVGWASSDYININHNLQNGTNISGHGKIATSVLNVRSGAGTSYTVIAKAYEGEKVELLESLNGWYKIKLSNGTIGWSSSDYITKVDNNDNNNSSNDNAQSGIEISGYGKIDTSVLNVRNGAGTSYTVIAKAYEGEKVELLESLNGWYKIKLSNGTIGWSSSDYITKVDNNDNNNSSNDNTQSGIEISGYGKIATSVLNVRSGAGTSYTVIAKAYEGEKVELLESLNGWYKIKLSNGTIGWSSSDYITKIDNNDNNNSSNDNDYIENDQPSIDKAQAVVNLATKQLGKPYLWGAEGPDSFDCSGLIYYVYKNAAKINLPRTSTEQSSVGTTISISNLKPGDLIFSSTDGSGRVNHVGIYVGNDEMIHSPKAGDVVKKVNINTSYWKESYIVSKRVL